MANETNVGPAARRLRVVAALLLLGALASGCRDSTTTVPVPTYDPPLPFALSAPRDGEPSANTTPSFSWTTALGAFSYRLQVSTTSDFGALVIDQAGLTATRYQLTSALPGATTYWWRVYGVNGTATTLATGAPRSFTVVSAENGWQAVGSDVRHTGHNAVETGQPPLTSAWTVTLAAASLHPVVYEGGRLFATANTYFANPTRLWALDSSDGSTLWTHDFGSVFSVGQPSVFDGRVLVGQCNHTPGTFLWAFDAITGAPDWASPMSAQWERYASPIAVGGSVYTDGGYYGGLYGFDVATGAQLFFNASLEQYDEWSPAYDDGTLYTFIEGNLRSHDPATGAILSTVAVAWNWAGWSMSTWPVIGGGRVYVIAPPALYAIDPATGQIAWQTAGMSYSGAPALAAGVVYAISAGILHARDASTGALLWSFAGDTTLSYPPVIAAGHVYVASDAHVYAVRAADGAQVWSSAGGGWLTVAGGKLFVARDTGVLDAYALTP